MPTCINWLLAAVLLSPLTLAVAANNTLEIAQKSLKKGDFKHAYSLYMASAQAGDGLSEFTIGLFYRNGWGRTENPQQACAWFSKAAQQNIPAAQQFLAQCYEKGIHAKQDLQQAVYWYQLSANNGIHSSYCSIGDLYIAGKIKEKTISEGVALCKQAASHGVYTAAWQVGKLYFEGAMVKQDLQQAQQYLTQAANKLPEAAYLLGQTLEITSLQQPDDLKSARYWYESAASKGLIVAYYPTAKLYYEDDSSAAPQAKAYLWLKATIARSDNLKIIENSQAMLADLLQKIPPNWHASLDKKLTSHLNQFNNK